MDQNKRDIVVVNVNRSVFVTADDDFAIIVRFFMLRSYVVTVHFVIHSIILSSYQENVTNNA